MRLKTEESANKDAYFSNSNRIITEINRKNRNMVKSNSRVMKKSPIDNALKLSPAKSFFNETNLKHYTPLGIF